MSHATPAFGPSSTLEDLPEPGPGARLLARFIRLRHSRGRLFYAILLAALTGLVLNGPLEVFLGVLWFLSEGVSAAPEAIHPAVVALAFTVVVGGLYTGLWAVTMLLVLPLRALTEWAATIVFIGAILHRYAPGFVEAMPNWAFLLALASWGLSLLLRKTGLAFRPLPGLTRRHRARFTLPMPPDEAYRRLRAHPDRPHWDAGWAEITEVTPGDDSHLKVEVRRRVGDMTMWLHYTGEQPGRQFTVRATDRPDAPPPRPAAEGETLRFSPHGAGGTLVEVHTLEPHNLHTLSSDPMEDRIADYWAHVAAQLSGRADGTFTAAIFRPTRKPV